MFLNVVCGDMELKNWVVYNLGFVCDDLVIEDMFNFQIVLELVNNVEIQFKRMFEFIWKIDFFIVVDRRLCVNLLEVLLMLFWFELF